MNNNQQQLEIRRSFDATAAAVFQAFTTPHALLQWWAPPGITMEISKFELHEGGTFLYCFVLPDGNRMWGKFVYGKIIEPNSIEFINSFCDAEGNILPNPMSPVWPREVFNRLELVEEDGKTQMILTGHPLNASEEETNMFYQNMQNINNGFKATFTQLDAYLSKAQSTHSEVRMRLERTLNAPISLVWEMWTDAAHLANWWAPKGFIIPVCKWQPVPQSEIYVEMQAPDGTIYPMDGKILEVLEPSKLVFLSAALDGNGKRLFEVHNSIALEEQGTGTLMTLDTIVTNIQPGAMQYIVGQEAGWSSSIEKLNDYTATLMRSMYVTRILNAPIDLVWQAWTEPDRIAKWWGPVGFTNTIQRMDVRPGGDWEFIMHGPDGTNYPNLNSYVEVIHHRKIVMEHKSPKFLTTVIFTPQGQETMLSWCVAFEDVETRDKIVKAVNADEGLRQNVDKLEQFLAWPKR